MIFVGSLLGVIKTSEPISFQSMLPARTSIRDLIEQLPKFISVLIINVFLLIQVGIIVAKNDYNCITIGFENLERKFKNLGLKLLFHSERGLERERILPGGCLVMQIVLTEIWLLGP